MKIKLFNSILLLIFILIKFNLLYSQVSDCELIAFDCSFKKELSGYCDTSSLDRFEKSIVRFEKIDSANIKTRNGILFVGSSSIRKWKTLQKDMKNLPVINRGFGGSTIPELIYYAHRIILPYSPEIILLYAGENDLTEKNVSPDDVAETLKILVRIIKKHLPETQIYFISIKPSIARAHLWDKMQETNAIIKKYTESENNIDFIDVSSEMSDKKGNIRKDIFIHDNLHLNEKGYKIWTNKIKPILDRK